jgi:predicted small secreted protein
MLVVLIGLGLGIAGCANTIRGMGRDIENTGDAIEDAAS